MQTSFILVLTQRTSDLTFIRVRCWLKSACPVSKPTRIPRSFLQRSNKHHLRCLVVCAYSQCLESWAPSKAVTRSPTSWEGPTSRGGTTQWRVQLPWTPEKAGQPRTTCRKLRNSSDTGHGTVILWRHVALRSQLPQLVCEIRLFCKQCTAWNVVYCGM